MFKKLKRKIEFALLKQTEKSRWELRKQKIIIEGKEMYVLQYIEMAARMLKPIKKKGMSVNHELAMREYYSKYDIPGLRYYIKKMNGIISKDIKKIANQLTIKQ